VLLSAALMLAFPGSAGAFGPLFGFGSFGSGAGQLNAPRGVTVGPDGTTYVADLENHRVSVFAGDGSFVRAFGKGVSPSGGDICTSVSGCEGGFAGTSSGAMSSPKGVAFGPEGNLFVADSGNDRVDVYTPEGIFLRAFGKSVNAGPGDPDVCTSECQAGGGGDAAGEIDGPIGIDFDDSALLYVADPGNHRIDVFTASGDFVRAFGKDVESGGAGDVCTEAFGCRAGASDGSAGAIVAPYDVAALSGDRLAVSDEANNRVDIFSTAGTFVRAFGKDVELGGSGDVCTAAFGCQAGVPAAGAGDLKGPTAIAVDAGGDLQVADADNNRVDEFTPGGTFIRAFGEGTVDGAAAFQVCTAGTGCQAGGSGPSVGATPIPQGIAVDCHGAVYVAEGSPPFRVERFGEPVTATPPCVESSKGEPIKVTLVRAPSNKFHFAGLIRKRANGFAVLYVRVPGPGVVKLGGRGFRRLSRTARQATKVRLPIKPKVRLRHYLKRHGKGRIRAIVTFTPTGGAPRTLEKVIVLRRTRG
jgi:hypothetical protein